MTTFKVEDRHGSGPFLPLLRIGLPEWYLSSESKVNGKQPVTLDEITAFFSCSIEIGDLLLIGFYKDDKPIGYDIVRPMGGCVEGLQVYVDPEHRGGLFKAYSDWAVKKFGALQFTSTMPFWKEKAPEYGFKKVWEVIQSDGTPAVTWRKV